MSAMMSAQQKRSMKISNEPITLSPRHSQIIRALAHAVGDCTIEELIDCSYLNSEVDNLLECLANCHFEKGSPGWKRVMEASKKAIEIESDYEKFVPIAEKMPVYVEGDYEYPKQ